MLDLSEAGMAAWDRSLPPDIKAAIGDDIGSPAASLLEKLTTSEPAEATALVVSDQAAAASLGRARRIRLASWILGRVVEQGGDTALLVDALTGEDDEQGSGSGAQILFLEDLRALNVVIAMRVAAHAASPSALTLAEEAAIGLEAEPRFDQGGMP